MTIKLPNLEKTAVYLTFLFYISTNAFWGYRLFHDTNIFPAIASLAPILLLLLHYSTVKWRIPTGVVFASLAFYCVIIIRSGFSIKMILYYGMCIMLLFDSQIAEMPARLKHFYYFSFLFMLGSFINLLLPGVYRSVVLPAFANSNQYAKLIRWSNRSAYMIIPGFANQTSFNVCHFVYGLGYLLCRRFACGEKLRGRWIVVALLGLCLVLTNKRAHFLFLFLALAITYYYSGDVGKKGKRVLILVIVGLAALALVFLLMPRLNIGVFNKFNQTIDDLENDEDISSGRFVLYALAIKHFLQNPLFGIGWDRFRFLPDMTMSVQTHDIYLQLLCETGIIGFSVFMVFFIYALGTALKNCRLARTAEEKLTTSFSLFMQVFFLLYGITGNPLYDPPYYVPYFIICAFTFSQRRIFRNALTK